MSNKLQTIIYEDVKKIFMNKEESYDVAINEDSFLSVDWDPEWGEYRKNACVWLIIKRARAARFRLGDYKDVEDMASTINRMLNKCMDLEEYVNNRIKADQIKMNVADESADWIDEILDGDVNYGDEAIRAKNKRRLAGEMTNFEFDEDDNDR